MTRHDSLLLFCSGFFPAAWGSLVTLALTQGTDYVGWAFLCLLVLTVAALLSLAFVGWRQL